MLTAPTFAEYAAALDTAGCEVKRFFLEEAEDFAVTDALVDAVDESTDMVFLCQPNNPTGQLASPGLVEKLLRRCEACGAILAVDECFLDFLPDADRWTAKPLLESSSLVIFKAFTKLYGMAGVRLGYCLCGDEALLEKMQAAGQPWAVSSLAQAAGIAALKETAYVDEVRALIAQQRPAMTAGLRALGLRVIDGQGELSALPRTCRPERTTPPAAVHRCAAARNYPGLGPEWYRTAVRTAPEKRTAAGDHEGGAGMSRAKCIMVQGTMSGAGKSLLVRGALPHLCAGRPARRALQEPEHGPEQLRHQGRP